MKTIDSAYRPSSRRVVLRVSPEFLAQALGLPEGARVLGVEADYKGSLRVGVEHPGLPDVPEYSATPEASLMWHVEAQGAIEKISASWEHAPYIKWPIYTRVREGAARHAEESPQ
jgi:hypothetical protein